jgi:hypothetical protein
MHSLVIRIKPIWPKIYISAENLSVVNLDTGELKTGFVKRSRVTYINLNRKPTAGSPSPDYIRNNIRVISIFLWSHWPYRRFEWPAPSRPGPSASRIINPCLGIHTEPEIEWLRDWINIRVGPKDWHAWPPRGSKPYLTFFYSGLISLKIFRWLVSVFRSYYNSNCYVFGNRINVFSEIKIRFIHIHIVV